MRASLRTPTRKFTWILLSSLFCLLSAKGAPAGKRDRLPALESEITPADVQAEIAFGRQVAVRILGVHSLLRDEDLTRYVNRVGKSLGQFSKRPELEFVFGVLDSDAINALSAPGGYVFVTRGAIEQMHDEAELASVLAHEIVHVSERHLVRDLDIRSMEGGGLASLSQLVGGSFDPLRTAFSEVIEKAIDELFEEGRPAQDELDSDAGALILLAMAGYDPAALSRLLHRLEELDSAQTDSLRNLYPPLSERVARLGKELDRQGLEGGEWKTGKDRFDEQLESLHSHSDGSQRSDPAHPARRTGDG
jgi:predicted Zn-dependent protease